MKRILAALLITAATAGSAAASSSNPRAGRAYVFSGADGSLLLTLLAPDVIEDGRFGEAVAGAGDVNGDMVPDLAVGASAVPDGGFKHAGHVYLFSGVDGSLLRTISAPAPAAGNRFGFSIAPAGDLNADAKGDLAVGAPRVRAAGKGRVGAAYLISGADGSTLATLMPPIPRKGAEFGISVAAGTDVTGDLLPEIAVGAPADAVGGLHHVGTVNLFDALGNFEASIPDPAPLTGARFGESVSFMSDVTGDSIADLVIGADAQDFSINDFAGFVFLFSAPGGVPAFIKGVHSPTAEPFANFGFSVAGFSDLDGDGIGDFAGASPDEDISSTSSVGRVFVLGGDPNNTPTIKVLDDPAPHSASFFGGSVAALPDLNSDGFPDLAVGSELHKDPNGIRAGRAYVVEAKTLGAILFTMESPTGDVCARFGWSVAPAGDVNGDMVPDVIVGAPFQRVTTRYASDNCF